MKISTFSFLVPALLTLVMLSGAEEDDSDNEGMPLNENGGTQPVNGEPQQPLATRLLNHKYLRVPPMALQAMAQQMAGILGEDAVERFAADVQSGAWKAMRATLNTLPEKDAIKVYDYVLSQLSKNNATLLPGEVIDLAESAPGELSDRRLSQLGNILRNSIDLVSATGSLVARLEVGTAQFGGRDPAHRGRAAALLLAAGRVIEAGSFLPPLNGALAAGDDLSLDLHARFLTAIGRERKQPAELLKAWELSLSILQRNDPKPEIVGARSRAVARCLELLDEIPVANGDAWLHDVFSIHPEQGHAVLAAVATQVASSLAAKDKDQRTKALKTQRRVVTVLLAGDATKLERWRTTLDLLTLGWLNEASLVMLDEEDDGDTGGEVEKYIRQQFRRYGGQLQANKTQYYRNYFRQEYFQNRNRQGNELNQRGSGNNGDVPPLSVTDLLASAPTAAWLALLDSSLAQRLRSLEGEFVCRSGNRTRALSLIEELIKDEPQRAARLARSLVRGFNRSLEPAQDEENQNGNQQNNNGASAGGGIPLTRAHQTRNLAQLSSLLARISELPVEPVPPADVVNAFVACHSPAEVFRAEDIASVLGDPQALPTQTLVNLVSVMRERLAEAWRKPDVQQKANTQRSDAEVVNEVKRGYDLATTLCAQSLERHRTAWQMILVQAALNFDHGEFVYGQKAPLAVYTALRDASFAGFSKAAQAYAQALNQSENSEQKPEVTVYSRWFAAALGASDLSYLSRQQEADGDQVAAVRDALAKLPGPQADAHRELFARQVVDSLGEIHAELKPRYLRHALRIIGDSPLSAQVKKIVADYDELLNEIQLDLSVDGATAVGNGRPFGAFLSLRHTTALGRESGGFSKYLQNDVNTSSGAQVNYRNDLEKHLRETLSEHFTVESITFHPATVAAHGYGRDGWRELPLAYLVLKTKDASVDRLPKVHIDLDFIDGHGAVILPVTAGIKLIDARSVPIPRVSQVTGVDMTLDDREISTGIVRMEIRAAGKGLIGELETVLNPAVAGFTVTKIDDHGPTVGSLEVDGSNVHPLGERLWQVEYAPAASVIPTTFTFPAVATDVTVKRQRYHDADLLDAAAAESLSPRQPWSVIMRPWLSALGVGLLLCAVAWWVRRRRLIIPVSGPRHTLPPRLTPFTVLAVLRSVHADPAVALDAAGRTRLAGVIADLEQRSFARDGQVPAETDLGIMAREWVAQAAT